MTWIDVHHHALLPSIVGKLNIKNVDIPVWSPEASLEMMDRDAIQAALLSLNAPGVPFEQKDRALKMARDVNERLSAIVRSHPTRFGAFCTLPLPYIDESIEELDYAIEHLKLDGVGLYSNYGGRYLGSPEFEPLLRYLNERGVVAHLHPTVPKGNGWDTFELPPSLFEFTFDTTRAIVSLLYSGSLEKFPNLKLIVSHAGGTIPFLAKRLTYGRDIQASLSNRQPADVIGLLGRLYYDTAVSGNRHALSSLLELVGPDHILFGSDFPFLPTDVLKENREGLISFNKWPDSDLANLKKENFRRLFPAAASRFGA